MALPAVWNGLKLFEGDEFTFELRLRLADGTVDNLDEFPVAKAQIRATHAGELMAEFTATVLPQGADTEGKVRLHLPTTEADKLVPGDAFWDLQLERENGTGRRTRVEGKVKIRPQVTR